MSSLWRPLRRVPSSANGVVRRFRDGSYATMQKPKPKPRQPRAPRDSEFRAYSKIQRDLESQGWNPKNPATHPTGEVYWQGEVVADAGLKQALSKQKPENVVVVSSADRVFWAIEAKGSMADLDKAVSEARTYAEAINAVPGQSCRFYTGVAGNDTEGFVRRTFFISSKDIHEVVNFEGAPLTGLISRTDLAGLLDADTGTLSDLVLEEEVLLEAAKRINETLHGASVNKDDRAPVVASLLLTVSQNNMPDKSLTPKLFVKRINDSAEAALAKSKKEHFAPHIALRLPTGEDAQRKTVDAYARVADELRKLNISAAMRSGTDVLGQFYEAFLKYGNAAKDLGIVLTPRHVTKWASTVTKPSVDDVIFDPTAGTGGFLVSAFDYVRATRPKDSEFDFFRMNRIFGIEQQPKIAALAVINMIFRGDGSTNIIDDDALKQYLRYESEGGKRTAAFGPAKEGDLPGATRVLMNPPFALKKEDEREYRFVDIALSQMEDNGVLFAVLPAPVLVKSGGPLDWRRDRLLAQHTVRAVVSFPEDLFYPVSIDTVGLIVEKGRAHQATDEVLWARVERDGFAKVKGKRLRMPRVRDDLAAITSAVTDVVANPASLVASVPGLIKKACIDLSDPLLELVPQAYLDEPLPSEQRVLEDLSHAIREYLAFLIRTADGSTVARALRKGVVASRPTHGPHDFKLMALTEIFGQYGHGIKKGSIHALNVETQGAVPVVSTSTEYNGIHGFYDLDPSWPRLKNVITVASNGTPLTSFYHPYEIVAKDDMFVCVPKDEMPLATIMYIITALNAITWRFSYYRKCYENKIHTINIWMPVGASGGIDHNWLQAAAESCDGWSQLVAAIPHWTPSPWRALGRRTRSN